MRNQKDFITSIILLWTHVKWSTSFIVPSHSFFLLRAPFKVLPAHAKYQHRPKERLYQLRLYFTSSHFMGPPTCKSLYLHKKMIVYGNLWSNQRKIKSTKILYSKHDNSKLSTDPKREKTKDVMSLTIYSLLILCFNAYFNTVTSIFFDALFITFQMFMTQLENSYDMEPQEDEGTLSKIYEDESDEWILSKPVRNLLLFFGSVMSSLLISPMGFATRTNAMIDSDQSSMIVNTFSYILLGTMSTASIYLLFRTKINGTLDSDNDDDLPLDSLSKQQLDRWDDAFKRITIHDDNDNRL